MLRRFIATAVLAGFALVGTGHADERTRRLKLNDLFQRASAEHQRLLICASNMPLGRKILVSSWKSDVEKALKNVRENSNVDPAALQRYVDSVSEIDWSMTLGEQQSLCGKETDEPSWFRMLTHLSTSNIVRDAEFILKYD